MPYKETLRRQMVRTARLDSFFEIKRRKSKKKTRHKAGESSEDMECTPDASPRANYRSQSTNDRLKSESSDNLRTGSDTNKVLPTPRSKSVTFMDDRRSDEAEMTSYRDSDNCDKNIVSIIKKSSSTGSDVRAASTAFDGDRVTGNVSSDSEADPSNFLEDSSEIRSAYKNSRSSIKTLSSLVKNVKPDKQETVLECRRMFREEILRLRHETEDFRIMCLKQIEKQKKAVEKHRKRCLNQLSDRTSNGEMELESELQGLAESMEYLQHKQVILDKETELLNREEEIEKKQKYLEDFEHEIQDIELMLRHRQAICDRRQAALNSFDEELNNLKIEIEETKDEMEKEGIDTSTASERAKENWEATKRNMLDKQQVLENTVQKYRTELATTASALVGKDILIQKLNEKVKENEDQFHEKDKKIKSLEMKLEIALSEIRQMENKMDAIHSNTNNNNNNHLTLDKFHLVREASQDSIINRDSSQDSGIGPRDLSPRNSQDSHISQDSHESRRSLRGSPDSQLSTKDGSKSDIGSPGSTNGTLKLPEIPGTPMSHQGSSQTLDVKALLKTEGSASLRSFVSFEEDSFRNGEPRNSKDSYKFRSKDKIVRHAARKQSIANGNLSKLSMLKHGDDMKSGACSVM
ncbi:hypothetical protein LOTGIDRAFT_161366 [Lottia gigantea]|uniref:Uncharacterized protein n=1 Tax=Lottia gigantea TaxID=225164 RepID=V4BYF6_LOTGI|nr:hypothetical protein LOTGIDRAFT_161366 [Lottia gigantea]ESO94164.1 hypothetical protein LOTGIDRAFT_161366 [Lottia gigantea]